MDRILVVDFGGQYAHLISNRLRRLGFLVDIALPEDSLQEIRTGTVRGLILSGGPSSVYEKHAPSIDSKIFSSKLPVLGICYGHQLIAYKLGGEVSKGAVREYGLAKINIERDTLFDGLGKKQVVWMSHGDSVKKMPAGFRAIAGSGDCRVAGMADDKRNIFGIQFHPEVMHTVNGIRILENFAGKICSCKREWNPENYANEIYGCLKNVKKVFLLVSGGVDSVVLFTLLNKALGKENVFGLHVDTGFMRADESEKVRKALERLGFDNLEIIDCSEKFLDALKDTVGPEEKRKIIGNLFIDIISEKSERILSDGDWVIAQGTIYPDTIESKGTKNAQLIKTHHNRVPKMQILIRKGKVIEPLSHLYKDEVRALGKTLGLPDRIVKRHPFPGPGLAVRILCNDKKAEDVSRINEKVRRIEKSAFVLPIKSVGVQGDCRTYKHPAVISAWKGWPELERISTSITNKMPEINRVLLLVKKRKGLLTLKDGRMTKSRINLLRRADAIVTQSIKKNGFYDKIWQMPVVLAPLSVDGGESIILRPVDSQEAMTARFSRIPPKIVKNIADSLLRMKRIDAVFYDITNKPPATIEWE
ncbi:MAG: glutamine-hydrolyzing GMP synthase [archaeon]